MALPAPRVLTIENEAMFVSVDISYGARVTALLDKRSGRQWLYQGGRSDNNGEEAVYFGAESIAWDECFPTIGRCDATATPWKRRLRDHGNVWGRPWAATGGADFIDAAYTDELSRFRRKLSLAGNTLTIDYTATNLGVAVLPFLWCQHSLLATGPGDVLDFPGLDAMNSAFVAEKGVVHRQTTVPWPVHELPLSFPRFDVIQGAEKQFAAKFYADVAGQFRATVGNDEGRLEIGWDAAELPSMGLWLNYGSWPGNGLVMHQVAIEPATAGYDHLDKAIEGGASVDLAPGASKSWRVTYRLV